jgi:hypothetical protein
MLVSDCCGSFSEARRNYSGVRCVPFAAPNTARFSVSYEKTDAQIQLTRGRVVPRDDSHRLLEMQSAAIKNPAQWRGLEVNSD